MNSKAGIVLSLFLYFENFEYVDVHKSFKPFSIPWRLDHILSGHHEQF